MMLYQQGRNIAPDEITVRLNPGEVKPFAIIDLGPASLFIQAPEDADALIKAAVEAKSLLMCAQHYSPEQMAELDAPAAVSA